MIPPPYSFSMRSWMGVSRKSSAGRVILSSQSSLKSIACLLSVVALMGSSMTAAGVWLWMLLIAIHFPSPTRWSSIPPPSPHAESPCSSGSRPSSSGPGASSSGAGLRRSPVRSFACSSSPGQLAGRTMRRVCLAPWMPRSVGRCQVMRSLPGEVLVPLRPEGLGHVLEPRSLSQLLLRLDLVVVKNTGGALCPQVGRAEVLGHGVRDVLQVDLQHALLEVRQEVPPALMISVWRRSAFSFSGCRRWKDCSGPMSSVVFAMALMVERGSCLSGLFSTISCLMWTRWVMLIWSAMVSSPKSSSLSRTGHGGVCASEQPSTCPCLACTPGSVSSILSQVTPPPPRVSRQSFPSIFTSAVGCPPRACHTMPWSWVVGFHRPSISLSFASTLVHTPHRRSRVCVPPR